MSDVFLDTNVLAYAFDTSDQTKQERAMALMTECTDAAISTQVMLEWFNVVTRRLAVPMPVARATELLQDWPRAYRVVPTDPDLVIAAARLTTIAQLSLWDAMIIAAAVKSGCTTLYTEDLNAGQVIHGVTVVNPFDE